MNLEANTLFTAGACCGVGIGIGIGLAIAWRRHAARDGASIVIAAKSATSNPKLP